MNKDALIDAIANIDDEYILDAHAEASKTNRRARIIKIAAVAAAVCAIGAAIGAVAMKDHSDNFKRISFEDDVTLNESLKEHIGANTKLINSASAEFPNQISKYSITERRISDKEYEQMLQQLDIPSSFEQNIKRSNNSIFFSLASYTDYSRGYFDESGVTEKELEAKSLEILEKLSFIDGEYDYSGAVNSLTVSDNDGVHLVRAGISFRRKLDGFKIYGNDKCRMWFDGSGLVEFDTALYDYQKNGTLDLIPLEIASQRILAPDSFELKHEEDSSPFGVADTLQVERIELRFENQYSKGCTILQPVYCFIGTATDTDGVKSEFVSKVIAIPE